MEESDILPGFEAVASYTTEFRLHHEDCIEGMRKMKKESVDLVVTSPPYNLGIGYAEYDDNRSPDEYLDWARTWAAEIKRVLKPTGSFFLNVGASPVSPWMPFELALALRDLFVLQNTIHWIKSITVERKDGTPLSVGHFKPINSKRFLNDCHEYVFHFTKEGDVPVDRLAIGVEYADKSNIARWSHTSGKDKRCRGNNWFVPYDTIQSRTKERPHPATFPVELARKCIRLQQTPPEKMTMMDPFLGIGNAAIAAGDCGVANFTGFEIDEVYLEEARRRTGTT